MVSEKVKFIFFNQLLLFLQFTLTTSVALCHSFEAERQHLVEAFQVAAADLSSADPAIEEGGFSKKLETIQQRAEKLIQKMLNAGKIKEAKDFAQNFLKPILAVHALGKHLDQCRPDPKTAPLFSKDTIQQGIASQLQVSACQTKLDLTNAPEAVTSLIRHLKSGGILEFSNGIVKEKNEEKLRDTILSVMRRSVISNYFLMQSMYLKPFKDDPLQAIRQLTGKSAIGLNGVDKNIIQFLDNLRDKNNFDSTLLKDNLFSNTKKLLKEIYESQILISKNQSLLDEKDQYIYEKIYKFRGFNPDSLIYYYLKSRYGIQTHSDLPDQTKEDRSNFLSVSFSDEFPNRNEELAEEVQKNLDHLLVQSEMISVSTLEDETALRPILKMEILEIRKLLDTALGRIQFENYIDTPGGNSITNFRRAERDLPIAKANKKLAQEKLLSTSPLAWQKELEPYYLGKKKSLPTNDTLNQALLSYFKNTEKLLRTEIDKIANGNPREQIKSALENNFTAVLQALMERPEFVDLICEISLEKLIESENKKTWDTIFGLTAAASLAAISFIPGGAILTGSAILVGSASAAKNTYDYFETKQASETAKLYLAGSGQGTPEEINFLIRDANWKLFFAVLDGALSAGQVAKFWKGVDSLKALQEATVSREALLRLAQTPVKLRTQLWLGQATQHLSGKAHDVFAKVFRHPGYTLSADDLALIRSEGLEDALTLFQNSPTIVKALNFWRGIASRSTLKPSLNVWNWKRWFVVPKIFFLPDMSFKKIRVFNLLKKVLKEPAYALSSTEQAFVREYNLTHQLARLRHDLSTLKNIYGGLHTLRLAWDGTKGALLLTAAGISLAGNQYISSQDSFNPAHPEGMSPTDDKVELIFFSPLPHMAIRMGGTILNFGMNEIETLSLPELFAGNHVGFGKLLSGNHTRIELKLTEDEKKKLLDYFIERENRQYISVPPLNDCISESLKALKYAAGIDVPAPLNISQAGTIDYFKLLNALKGDGSHRVGKIIFASNNGQTALSKSLDIWENLLETSLFIELFPFAIFAGNILKDRETTFDIHPKGQD